MIRNGLMTSYWRQNIQSDPECDPRPHMIRVMAVDTSAHGMAFGDDLASLQEWCANIVAIVPPEFRASTKVVWEDRGDRDGDYWCFNVYYDRIETAAEAAERSTAARALKFAVGARTEQAERAALSKLQAKYGKLPPHP